MACIYGSERKFPTDTTIIINPYEGVNNAAAIFMNLAAIPPQIEFDAIQVCSLSPPEYIEIELIDFTNLAVLNEKVYNNARRSAWFKGCKCKDRPVSPPPPAPPTLPPDGIPLIPFDYSCDSVGDNGWRIEIRFYGRQDSQVTYKSEVFLPFYIYPFTNLFIERSGTDSYNIDIYGDGNFILSSSSLSEAQFRTVVDWAYYWCGTSEEPSPPPEGENPSYPNPCDDCSNSSCRYDENTLKQVDKLEIIADLRLWTSESNNRIRDELADIIGGARDNVKNDIVIFKEELFDVTTTLDYNAQQYRDDIKIRLTERTQELKDWIDGAKNQLFSAIAGSTAATATAIAGSTTATATAIATATATIQGAITTATTTLTNVINGIKDSIEATVKSEVEKFSPRYRTLTIECTSPLSSQSVTYGLRDSPDKYTLGWIQFHKDGAGGKKFYYERQFLVNKAQVFVCPEPNIDAGYSLHILPIYEVNATLGWSSKKE